MMNNKSKDFLRILRPVSKTWQQAARARRITDTQKVGYLEDPGGKIGTQKHCAKDDCQFLVRKYRESRLGSLHSMPIF